MVKRKRVTESEDSDFEEDKHTNVDDSEDEGKWEDHEDGREGEDVSSRYKKLKPREHILVRPETYVGSVDYNSKELWVWDKNRQMLVQKKIKYVPALYKIFDEILVNAADNKIRDKEMTRIDVNIDAENNEISIKNNGKGIPIEMHKDHGVYIPTMIFGMLLTGDNFNDDQKRITGGRNGYGAKLCNIYSTEFSVETVDSSRNKKFKQVWRDNMSIAEEPKVTTSKVKDYTVVTFKPDLARFHMTKLDDDIISLLTKRVYDIAGTTGVIVYLNGTKLKIKSFKDYVALYALDKKLAYEVVNERWAVGVTLSDGTPQQVSFVNSICTTNGGKHVDNITQQIANKLKDKLNKKNKGAPIKPQHIKNQLFVFVNALIINPAFDSQTKDLLTTNISQFGSKCTISDTFMKQIGKLGIEDAVLRYADAKSDDALKRQSGKKRVRVSGISKLDDANDAGGRASDKCTLILTEGDSAKALAVAGLSVIGRDKYGVFPLKGKPLNVRDCATSKVTSNEEIKALTQILGLQHKQTYTKQDLKKLRYGSVMIMADQDHDGSHIKGLLINWIHKFWPSLLEVNGFLKEFITPIIKATNKRKKNEISFYSIPEYKSWRDSLDNNTSGWDIKYYKGLGTSTAKEAKEYFNNINQHQKVFKWEGDDSEKKIITAFAKNKADERKKWLAEHKDSTDDLDHTKKNVCYSEFFDKEFVLFSLADCARSIPSLVDGLKPGQRKILYCCFKRNLKKEIKVAQLSGYVAEHSAYHHGEASLSGTITNMAQNFVGANNINLLVPGGQFGTRAQGGKDSASPRYICTNLSKITRYIYDKSDDDVLEYLDDDGQQIEPKYYVPIIPMVLVNGAEGIGTAWSTYIPNYNPRDIVDNVKRLIKGEETIDMTPWFKGFEGDTAMLDSDKWETRGRLTKIDDTTIKITELPVRVWTQTYKEQLEKFMTEKKIEDFRENHTDLTVSFSISMSKEQMKAAEEKGLDTFFKLSKKFATTNMTLFSPDGTIKTYSSTHEILKDFYDCRREYYVKRRDYMLSKLNTEFDILSNKARFILAVISGDVVIKQRKKVDLLKELHKKGYVPYPKNKIVTTTTEPVSETDNEDPDDGDNDSDETKKFENGYNYLLSMPLWSLTIEKVKKLESEKEEKHKQIQALKNTTIQEIWLRELDKFLEVLTAVEEKEVLEEKEYMKKLAKKKGNKVEIRERVATTSLNRPAPIIVPKKEKKARTVSVKKEEASSSKGKQTKLKFKQDASSDEEDESDEEIEVVETKTRAQPTRGTKARVKKEPEEEIITFSEDDSDEDAEPELLIESDEEETPKPKRRGNKKEDDDDYDPDADSKGKRTTRSNATKKAPAVKAPSKSTTVDKMDDDGDVLFDDESPAKKPPTTVVDPVTPPAATVVVSRANRKRRRVQTNTLDSYFSPTKSAEKEKKKNDEDDDEVATLNLSEDDDDEVVEQQKASQPKKTTRKPITKKRKRSYDSDEDSFSEKEDDDDDYDPDG